jgi:hypothetical protein
VIEKVLEVQQGIWVDEQWLRHAGLGTRLQIVVHPGEIRILTAPTQTENPDVMPTPAENLFKQELLRTGLLKEITSPYLLSSEQDRVPLSIQGKPLSEIILEERR